MKYTSETVAKLLHKKRQEDYLKYENYTEEDLLIELINQGVITDFSKVDWSCSPLYKEVGAPYIGDDGWRDTYDLSFVPYLEDYVNRIHDIETRIRLLKYWSDFPESIIVYKGYQHEKRKFAKECDRLVYTNKQLVKADAATEPSNTNEKPIEDKPKEEASIIPNIPHAELLSEEGWVLMRKVQKAGLLDENFMPVKGKQGLTKPKASLVVTEIAKRIDIENKRWKVFETLWSCSRLGNSYQYTRYAKYEEEFTKTIKNILDN